MRPIGDILRDVIEALEPREGLPEASRGATSPLGLWGTTVVSSGQVVRWCWGSIFDVDTAVLIDAALASRGLVVVLRAGYEVEVYDDHEQVCSYEHEGKADSREAVILAVAKALGVETEK